MFGTMQDYINVWNYARLYQCLEICMIKSMFGTMNDYINACKCA